ncbi:hypothetical protein GCM10027168_00890 [Streptomyces capparidis]
MSNPQLFEIPPALLASIVEEAARRLSAQLRLTASSPEPERPAPGEQPLALTVEQAAKRLGIGRTRMYALVRTGAVRSITIGRLRRIPEEALNEYITTRMIATTGAPAAA